MHSLAGLTLLLLYTIVIHVLKTKIVNFRPETSLIVNSRLLMQQKKTMNILFCAVSLIRRQFVLTDFGKKWILFYLLNESAIKSCISAYIETHFWKFPSWNYKTFLMDRSRVSRFPIQKFLKTCGALVPGLSKWS